MHNYFAYRARLNRLEFGRLMKEGRQSLAIGLGFLLGCLAVSNALTGQATGHLPEFDAGEPHHCGLGGHVAADADLFVRLVAPPSAWTGLREAEPDARRGPQTTGIVGSHLQRMRRAARRSCKVQSFRSRHVANCTIGKHAPKSGKLIIP